MPLHRNHVERRSYDHTPPMQCVAELNEQKPSVNLKEANEMTAALAGRFEMQEELRNDSA